MLYRPRDPVPRSLRWLLGVPAGGHTLIEMLGALAAHTEKHGHYGGVRLLRALCCRFHAYCAERAIPLHATGFCVSYKTNIPKQTGLSGSSSIIVAGLRCLLEHYDVTIPLAPKTETATIDVDTAEHGPSTVCQNLPK